MSYAIERYTHLIVAGWTRTTGARTGVGKLVRWNHTALCVLAVALAPLALLWAEVVETTPLTVVIGFMVSSVATVAGLALMGARTWLERKDRRLASQETERQVKVRPGAGLV